MLRKEIVVYYKSTTTDKEAEIRRLAEPFSEESW